MKKLGVGIGFDDSKFKSCEIISDGDSDTLIVYLDSWDAHIIKIVFLNVIQFYYKYNSFVLGVYEMDKDEFFKKAIANYWIEEIPDPNPFKKFSIIDIEDVEFIKVVAEEVIVSKELQHHNGVKF